tara:strand:+ start:244 stop:1554 length:1311 start_codon:yes stop_codon:yes gene_type:complete
MNLTKIEIKNHIHTLPNGLTLVVSEMPHIHTVEIGMFVRAGLRFENENNNGVSHFLEHMMFRGNKNHPDSVSLSREFEKLGRDLRASTLGEYTYYGFSPHPSNLDHGMELFADFFTDPNFADIELERQIILEEYLEDLNAEGDNIDINNHACKLLYDKNPLAWPTIGTEATIKAIDEDMLRDYFREYYIPQNMILSVAGPITGDHIIDLSEKTFSELPTDGQPVLKNHFLESIIENQSKPAFAYQYDVDSQIQMQICFRAVSYNSPDYYTVSLINRIFDDGISSRMQRALREKLGLAYSVECRATSMSDVGTFDFDVTVSKERIVQVTRTIFEEIRRFVEFGAESEEFEHVKKRYVYDLDFDLDDPYKQLQRYGFAELFSRQVTVEEEKKIIRNVTLDKIHATARRIFVPKNLNFILVGPFTLELKTELEHLVDGF